MRILGWLAVAALGLLGCGPKTAPASSTPVAGGGGTAASAQCPACDCTCECGGQAGEVRDLVRAAQRKIAHHDPDCMDDLNRIRALDRRTDEDLGYMRAQCEMVAGHCDAGRARVIALMREQQGMGPDMAQKAADGLVGMHCRSAKADDRDRLLGALYDLNDGAFMNRRTRDFCQARIQLVRELLPRVRPQGPDDHPIASAKDAVWIAASQCLARAGDCSGAWTAFEQLHPRDRFDAVPPGQRPKVLRSTFESMVPTCSSS